MKSEIWQKRQFILSSFSRQKIQLNSEVYRFIDEYIKRNFDSSEMTLEEFDYHISQEFIIFRENS